MAEAGSNLPSRAKKAAKGEKKPDKKPTAAKKVTGQGNADTKDMSETPLIIETKLTRHTNYCKARRRPGPVVYSNLNERKIRVLL
jgi:hypothetical protein